MTLSWCEKLSPRHVQSLSPMKTSTQLRKYYRTYGEACGDWKLTYRYLTWSEVSKTLAQSQQRIQKDCTSCRCVYSEETVQQLPQPN